jgi:hypothetical protein
MTQKLENLRARRSADASTTSTSSAAWLPFIQGRGVMATLANAPLDPATLFGEEIDDLMLEARNYLDGEPIANEQQAEAVSSLLNRLRRVANDADERAQGREEAARRRLQGRSGQVEADPRQSGPCGIRQAGACAVASSG